MVYFLYSLFFLSCFVLVAAVLLQPGKTDAGALFTSNVSSSAFSPRGTATILSKITITAAVIFMVSALLLSMPALTGNVSVLSSNPDAPAEENVVPEQPGVDGAVPDANTAPVTDPAAEPNANTDVPAAADTETTPAAQADQSGGNDAPANN